MQLWSHIHRVGFPFPAEFLWNYHESAPMGAAGISPFIAKPWRGDPALRSPWEASTAGPSATSIWQAQPENRDLEETPGFSILWYPCPMDQGWLISLTHVQSSNKHFFWVKVNSIYSTLPQRACSLNFLSLYLVPSRFAMFCASLMIVSISANNWSYINYLESNHWNILHAVPHWYKTFFLATSANIDSYASWDLSGSATCSAIPFFFSVHLVLGWHQLLHCKFVCAEAHCTDFSPFFKILSFGIVILWTTPLAVLGNAQKPVNR